jgi:hypothetical protein
MRHKISNPFLKKDISRAGFTGTAGTIDTCHADSFSGYNFHTYIHHIHFNQTCIAPFLALMTRPKVLNIENVL